MNDKIKELATKFVVDNEAWGSMPYQSQVQVLSKFGLLLQKEAAEQKPVGYFYKDHNGGLREAFDLQFKSAHTPLYASPVDQSARIAELEAEVLRLAGEVANRNKRALDGDNAVKQWNALYDDLTAAQAENKKLRAGLTEISTFPRYRMPADIAKDTLTTPSDNSALEALIEAERQKVAEACAKVVDYHYDECEPWLDREMLLREWKGFVK